ncbi:MAG: PAC2 family protein [Acidimicrobiales bacterium]
MEYIHWERRPVLRRPVLLVAFEGWNDAGDAASLALAYLAQAWNAQRFATIDPEDFYDFTDTRPQVKMAGASRSIEWPTVDLLAAPVLGTGRDVVLVRGVEPQLKWRTFASVVVEVALSLGVELSLILGALLADVAHTKPVRVSGSSDNEDLAGRLGLLAPTYEGPTGIVGVLHDALNRAGVPSASLWAAVPHYVHQVPSPKAALALVERSAVLMGARVDPLELRLAAEEYERQINERVADDEDAAAYVAGLEASDESSSSDLPLPLLGDGSGLAEEAERYLRRHGGESGG